jgi:hypothetical protein
MSDTKYDSVLVGWTEEPKYNDDGQLIAWTVKLKDHELKDMMEKYLTAKTDKGGGNAYLTLFMSKGGKPCARVFDPNSEAAKENRAKRQEAVVDDLPF